MKHIQKLVGLALVVSMLFPLSVMAASSSSTKSCKKIVKDYQKEYAAVIKKANKEFDAKVKIAEKNYKADVKSGKSEVTALETLRQSTWTAFKARSAATSILGMDFVEEFSDNFIACMKADKSQTKKSAAEICSNFMNGQVKDALKEINEQIKLLKKTRPTSEEQSKFKEDSKLLEEAYKSQDDFIKLECDSFYEKEILN